MYIYIYIILAGKEGERVGIYVLNNTSALYVIWPCRVVKQKGVGISRYSFMTRSPYDSGSVNDVCGGHHGKGRCLKVMSSPNLPRSYSDMTVMMMMRTIIYCDDTA